MLLKIPNKKIFANKRRFPNFAVFCVLKKTRSNLFATIVDRFHNVIFSLSTGKLYPLKKNARFKCNTTSSTILGRSLGDVLKTLDIYKVHYIFKTSSRDSFISNILRGMASCGVKIVSLRDRYSRAHNGCRPKKLPRK